MLLGEREAAFVMRRRRRRPTREWLRFMKTSSAFRCILYHLRACLDAWRFLRAVYRLFPCYATTIFQRLLAVAVEFACVTAPMTPPCLKATAYFR